MRFSLCIRLACLALLSSFCLTNAAHADNTSFSLAEGKISLKSPAGWKKKQPSSGIVEHEFSIPKTEGDDADGRMTVMGAGGSVDANVDRWLGQFQTESGERLTKDKAKVEKLKVGGQDAVIVDMSGTYLDKPGGPFAPGAPVERKKYRMLAGVVMTKQLGNYFFKFYGPEKTVEANEDAFKKMLESLETK